MHTQQSQPEPDVLRARFTCWLEVLVYRARSKYLRKEEHRIKTISLDDLPEEQWPIAPAPVLRETEFDFEDDYTNPVTKKKEKGGLISFYITADIPKKSEIDYWLVNGVKYQYPKDISKFRVEDLDEATVYEVVFKGQAKKTDNKTYYTVTCRNCTFTYNGKTAASGKVPAGAKITITGTSSSSKADFDGTPSSVNRHFTSPTSSSSGKYVFTYTYTVNSDVSVSFAGVVN